MESIFDRRRSPRVVVADCKAHLADHYYEWDAQVENVGAGGCRLALGRVFKVGKRLQLALEHPQLPDKLEIEGWVAWAVESKPPRVGVAYNVEKAEVFEAATDWFERLVATSTELLAQSRRAPDRLAMDARILFGQPPLRMPLITAEELDVLRAMQMAESVADLSRRLGAKWERCAPAVFSLLSRGLATLIPALSVPSKAWDQRLAGIVAAPSASMQPPPAALPAGPGLAEATTAPDIAHLPTQVKPRPDAPRASFSEPTKVERPTPFSAQKTETAISGPPRDMPWETAAQKPGVVRHGNAQSYVDRALADLAEGDRKKALTNLRLALMLSPGDGEVQDLIAEIEGEKKR